VYHFGWLRCRSNYKRPLLISRRLSPRNQATNGLSAELAWWEVYQDATLQSLIRVLTNNYDLRIAVPSRTGSRASHASAVQFVPSVNYNDCQP